MIQGFEMIFTDPEKQQILLNIEKVLDAGMVIDFQFHEKLRSKIIALTQKKYCDFSSSNTMISEILYRSLGKKKAFFQGNMFVSPIFAARRAGMQVEFVDIELESLGMDMSKLEVHDIKDQVVCLMHTGGVVSDDIQSFREICESKSGILVEDCAQSFGSSKRGAHCGTSAHYGIFSFASTKIFTSVSGGAIAHDNEDVHDLIVTYTNCGKRVPFGAPVCDIEGFSARLTEIQSAILVGLNLEWRLKIRKKCSEIYYNELMTLEGKELRRIYYSDDINNYRLFILLNQGDEVKDFEKYAENEGWSFSPPVFRELPYQTPVLQKEFRDLTLPVTEDFCTHHLCLPVHEGMKESDAVSVAKSAKKYLLSSRKQML